MNKEPLISIIIPIYKVERYLRRCLNSVISQTYSNLEIILVDDGSPDTCPSICDEYAVSDNRIVVIHKENGGLSDARNAGLNICKGEYVSFIDSDDWVADCYIEALISSLLNNNADIAIGRFIDVTDDNITRKNTHQHNVTLLNSHEALLHLCTKDIKEMTAAWGKIFKRECFSNIRFPKGKLYEDSHTSYKIYCNVNKICLLDSTLYFYRIREGSIMRQTKSSIHALEAFTNRYFYLKKHNEHQAAFSDLPNLCWNLLFAYGSLKDSNCKEYGFCNKKEILNLYKKTVHDYSKIGTNRKTKWILKFFARCPFLYLFYRKFSPVHLRSA